jgi:hypothetical protein
MLDVINDRKEIEEAAVRLASEAYQRLGEQEQS